MSPQLSPSVPKLPKMELIAPRGAKVEGVHQTDDLSDPHRGKIIYTERVIDVVATKASATVRKDADGKEVWKKHQSTGEAQYPILDKVVQWKDVRYVLFGQDVGRHVKRVYKFEATAEELAELEVREREKTFLADFVRAAAEEGLTAAEVVRKIKEDTLGLGEALEQVEIDVTEEVVAEAIAEAAPVTMIERTDEDDTVGVADAQAPEKSAYELMREQERHDAD